MALPATPPLPTPPDMPRCRFYPHHNRPVNPAGAAKALDVPPDKQYSAVTWRCGRIPLDYLTASTWDNIR